MLERGKRYFYGTKKKKNLKKNECQGVCTTAKDMQVHHCFVPTCPQSECRAASQHHEVGKLSGNPHPQFAGEIMSANAATEKEEENKVR